MISDGDGEDNKLEIKKRQLEIKIQKIRDERKLRRNQKMEQMLSKGNDEYAGKMSQVSEFRIKLKNELEQQI